MAINVQRAVFMTIMPSYVAQGLGPSAILREVGNVMRAMPGVGVSVQKQWGLDQIRKVSGKMKYQDKIEAMPSDVFPKGNVMVETELSRHRKYRVFGTATYRDIETGEETQETMSMYTMDLNTKEGWTQEYIDSARLSNYRPDKVIVNVQWQAIEHNKGWSL